MSTDQVVAADGRKIYLEKKRSSQLPQDTQIKRHSWGLDIAIMKPTYSSETQSFTPENPMRI